MADVVLPGRCVACSTRIPPDAGERLVCAGCVGRLREPAWPRCPRCHLPRGTGREPEPDCLACRDWPPALLAARWSVALEPPADALVHGLKYEGWRDLAPFMAKRMARLDPAVDVPGGGAVPESRPVVVPVPTTRARERSRGYNQAGLLARSYARLRKLPLVEGLERSDGGGTQVALHPEERRANVERAFTARWGERARLEGSRVLLVDDVLTTGATAGAAARVLERAGASGVVVVTFARALPGRSSEAPAPSGSVVRGG